MLHNLTSENNDYTALESAFIIAAVILVMLWIILGNCSIIYLVLVDSKLRLDRQNWLLLSLASADLLVGTLIMPMSLTNEIEGRWTLGGLLCELWLALDVLFVTASILNLCAISLDRYWSIKRPLSHPIRRSKWHTIFTIAAVWALATLISFPPLAGWRPPRPEGVCSLSTDRVYVLYSALGSFFLPTILLLGVYIHIYRISLRRTKIKRRHSQRMLKILVEADSGNHLKPEQPAVFSTSDNGLLRAHSTPMPIIRNSLRSIKFKRESRSQSCTPTISQERRNAISVIPNFSKDNQTNSYESSYDDSLESESVIKLQNEFQTHASQMARVQQRTSARKKYYNQRRAFRQRDLHATVTLGAILLAFTLCWLPFFTLYVVRAFGVHIPEIPFDLAFWLGYCNSGINPVLYSTYHRDFRIAYRQYWSTIRHRALS